MSVPAVHTRPAGPWLWLPVERLHVEVTAEHIDMGVMCSARRCPIAYALVAALDRAGAQHDPEWSVSIGPTYAIVHRGYRRPFRGDLPDQARAWINAYDSIGGDVGQPFEFDVVLELVT